MRPVGLAPLPSPCPQPVGQGAARARPDTLFISIASYCDPLLLFTLQSAIGQAHQPSRLRFGVVEQALPGQQLQLDAPWADQVRWLRHEALHAQGPCWARALAMSLYQGEDWFFQIDSHTWFEPGWDEQLVHWAHHCAALNPRCIISCYPNPFKLCNGQVITQQVGPKVLAHAVHGSAQFSTSHPVLFFEGVPVDSDSPVQGLHLGAGCLLAPGRIANELPYDPWLYFHGEEQALALRAWTRGWDIFHVPAMPIYHLYHSASAPARQLHWSPELDAQRQVRSAQREQMANARLAALLWQGADLGAYGLGRVRTLADYAAFSGIDYAARSIAPLARKARWGYA